MEIRYTFKSQCCPICKVFSIHLDYTPFSSKKQFYSTIIKILKDENVNVSRITEISYKTRKKRGKWLIASDEEFPNLSSTKTLDLEITLQKCIQTQKELELKQRLDALQTEIEKLRNSIKGIQIQPQRAEEENPQNDLNLQLITSMKKSHSAFLHPSIGFAPTPIYSPKREVDIAYLFSNPLVTFVQKQAKPLDFEIDSFREINHFQQGIQYSKKKFVFK